MAKLKDIVLFLDNHLANEKFDDNSWNGLQVEGRETVNKVAFCVTAGLEVFKKAEKEKPDMIVAHHGLFWKNSNPSIKGWLKKRVVFLTDRNISFYACHLPLDAHPKLGNNAQLIKILGAEKKEPIACRKGKNIGWIGQCHPTSIKKVVERLEKSIGAKCLVLNYGKEKIKRIAVVSGGAPYNVFEAIEKEADLFITGDPADILEVVRDAKINVIFAGHYATETVGVKALSDLIKKKFKVQICFIDAPTNL